VDKILARRLVNIDRHAHNGVSTTLELVQSVTSRHLFLPLLHLPVLRRRLNLLLL